MKHIKSFMSKLKRKYSASHSDFPVHQAEPHNIMENSPISGITKNHHELVTDSTDNRDDDLELALQIQAQFDTDTSMAINSTNLESDRGIALKLQADFDHESTSAHQPPSPTDLVLKIQEFVTELCNTKCCRCHNSVLKSKENVESLVDSWFTKESITSFINCFHCNLSSRSKANRDSMPCLACKNKRGSVTLNSRQLDGYKVSVSWCCDKSRLFLIWCLLSYEVTSAPKKKRHNLRSASNPLKAPAVQPPFSNSSSSSSSGSNGVGYGGAVPTGFGFRMRTKATPTILQDTDQSDGQVALYLTALAALLPCEEDKSFFDQQPAPLLVTMLHRSAVLPRIAALLRNDSIENISKRRKIYHAVLLVTSKLMGHYALANVLLDHRIDYNEGERLLNISFNHLLKKLDDKLQPIAKIIQPLGRHADAYLKQINTLQQNYISMDVDEDLAMMCRKVVAQDQFLRANLQSDDSTLLNFSGEVRREKFLEDWHRDNCIDDVADEDIINAHYFSKACQADIVPAKGRMKRLATEIASLGASLPPGIYVRHGNGRLDLLKALITGPRDTPYENGLFEFDIFCKADYPISPPSVQFKTISPSRIGFNPNLYPDGKVCLSLLGTWQGQPWQPGQSTLLQLLVSIQSMILCDEPWCNEPGREGFRRTYESQQYNRAIRWLTIETAMIPWLDKKEIWGEVVSNHYRGNSHRIIKTLSAWLDIGMGGSHRISPFDVSLAQLNPPKAVQNRIMKDKKPVKSPPKRVRYSFHHLIPTTPGGVVGMPSNFSSFPAHEVAPVNLNTSKYVSSANKEEIPEQSKAYKQSLGSMPLTNYLFSPFDNGPKSVQTAMNQWYPNHNHSHDHNSEFNAQSKFDSGSQLPCPWAEFDSSHQSLPQAGGSINYNNAIASNTKMSNSNGLEPTLNQNLAPQTRFPDASSPSNFSTNEVGPEISSDHMQWEFNANTGVAYPIDYIFANPTLSPYENKTVPHTSSLNAVQSPNLKKKPIKKPSIAHEFEDFNDKKFFKSWLTKSKATKLSSSTKSPQKLKSSFQYKTTGSESSIGYDQVHFPSMVPWYPGQKSQPSLPVNKAKITPAPSYVNNELANHASYSVSEPIALLANNSQAVTFPTVTSSKFIPLTNLIPPINGSSSTASSSSSLHVLGDSKGKRMEKLEVLGAFLREIVAFMDGQEDHDDDDDDDNNTNDDDNDDDAIKNWGLKVIAEIDTLIATGSKN